MIDSLHFITQENDRYTHLEGMEAVLKAGVRWVQLRIKDSSEEEITEQGRQARMLCDEHQARLIINDNPAIARAVGADGVHLGKEDMSIAQARDLLGEGKIIGATANTIDDIASHAENGADYIGLGPFRFTKTKKKLSPILGLQGYRSIISECTQREINIPVIAIGGIDLTDIPALMGAGVHGIAASSMLINSRDLNGTARKILELLKQQEKQC